MCWKINSAEHSSRDLWGKDQKQESEERQEELSWQFDLGVSTDKNSKREQGTAHH